MEDRQDIDSGYEREAKYLDELAALAKEASAHLNNGCHPAISDLVRKSLALPVI